MYLFPLDPKFLTTVEKCHDSLHFFFACFLPLPPIQLGLTWLPFMSYSFAATVPIQSQKCSGKGE